MDDQLKQVSVSGYSQLSKTKLKEVKKFVSQCKRMEGYEPIFYWGSIENRKNPGVNELLCYNQQNTLVGFLSLYHFEEHEVEITVLTHPDYRNDLVYRGLWDALKSAISKVPFEIKRYAFTCNQENLALKEYLMRLGASNIGCTNKLGLTHSQYQKKISPLKSSLEFRAEIDADTPAIFALSDGEIVGSIYVQIEKATGYLYDFFVENGRGAEFKSVVLAGFLETLFKQLNFKKVLVDVNDAAGLSEYKKFHFKILTTYEHWTLPVFVDPLKQREKQLEELILNFQCYQVQEQLSYADYKH